MEPGPPPCIIHTACVVCAVQECAKTPLRAGATPSFVCGAAAPRPAYSATHPAHRLECAKALLRAGADANYVNGAGDLTLFWAVDGGPAMIQLFVRFGANVDAASPKV